ncbi:hypothetical protein OKW40_005857 [Paraburkholderia sp. RAU6.4a]|uniref:hypothetical protein n=1 Tax=Paraburkholderia sp. RAU6.4a TaxID=2991067 RepID=UPI003D1B8DFC
MLRQEPFGDGDTVASVMARADTALYAAKANGRNCVMLAGSSQRADDIVFSFPAWESSAQGCAGDA